ncbi:MAG: metallophosphoesterase [Candidatus Hodarchaeales archaeon]
MEKSDIIKIVLQYQYNINSDALTYINNKKYSEEDLHEFLRRLSPDKPVITKEMVKNYMKGEEKLQVSVKKIVQKDLQKRETQKLGTPQNTSVIPDKEISININLDIPYKLLQEPKIDAFRELFIDRYKLLSTILQENLPTNETIMSHYLQESDIIDKREGVLIGMIHDTQVLHTNRFVIQLEDPSSRRPTKCVIVQDSTSFPDYRNVLRDSVIGVSGVLPKNFQQGEITAFWGKDIFRPSLREHIPDLNGKYDSKVLCLADILYGAEGFSKKLLSHLIAFLNEEIENPAIPFSPREIEVIIIVGDLVEGTSQNTESELIDSYETQYSQLADLLAKIPSRIQIITIPGEHDASQLAIPQPAIDKKIGSSMYKLSNVKNHGNPLRLTINGMKCLVFHGQGSDKIFQNNFKIKEHDSINGFSQLLEYRHLSPEYGSFTSIAPYSKDYLVINEIPDVFITGHLHYANSGIYKGVRIASCGSLKHPKPENSEIGKKSSFGVFPLIDTKTGEITLFDLKSISK